VSVDLRVAHTIAAPPDVVWPVLVDWAGQARWIPFTTVRVVSDHQQGLGVRCEALSGFWLGRVPVGLLDRFTVTAWQVPSEAGTGVLEVLHTGPCFRGPGTFVLEPTRDGGTRVSCTEIFDVVGGALPTRVAGLLLPVMRAGFASSLRSLGKVSLASR
jgi:polyketide cyclase/dehydrase/lipid transport protein